MNQSDPPPVRTAHCRRELPSSAAPSFLTRIFFLAALPRRQRQTPQYRAHGGVLRESWDPAAGSERLCCRRDGMLRRPAARHRVRLTPGGDFCRLHDDRGLRHRGLTKLSAAFSAIPDKFVAAAPFPFLLAALLVLAFGPGALSLDALIKRFVARERPSALKF